VLGHIQKCSAHSSLLCTVHWAHFLPESPSEGSVVEHITLSLVNEHNLMSFVCDSTRRCNDDI
jgi:hypothetical protein